WNGKPNEGLKMIDAEIGRGIKQREQALRLKVRPGPADSSIFDEVNGDSPAKQQALTGIRWEKADKSPGSRIRGWSLLRARLKSALKDRPDEPGLFIFSTCAQFIRTVPVLPRDPKKPDDVDTDAEDHIADEVRYRLLQDKRITVVEPLRI
ncbi:MAG TPA: terminase, partial [Gammaproteobacteria bacterium]|nr:terminase [Gammaproteobacteria bacterium]